MSGLKSKRLDYFVDVTKRSECLTHTHIVFEWLSLEHADAAAALSIPEDWRDVRASPTKLKILSALRTRQQLSGIKLCL